MSRWFGTSNNIRIGGTRRAEQQQPSSDEEFARQTEALIPAEIRLLSGCHSLQTAADVSNAGNKLPNPAGKAGGACTSTLLEILYRHKRIQQGGQVQHQLTKPLTFQQVLLELRSSLDQKGYDQIPQLTSSRPLELEETPFTLAGIGSTGIRRALLVGINYSGQDGELIGCHNDVLNVKRYLLDEQGYLEHNVLVLIDDGIHHHPNRHIIIQALRQLVAQSVSGDSVYVHYSGHGGLLNPIGNPFKQNSQQYDETLYPLDHGRSGQIRDYSLFQHFVKPMPRGVTVTAVMDCCHSGTVLDLPYSFRPTDRGTIQMRRSMDSLSNLALLYLLSGSLLPAGFDNVAANIEAMTGGNINDYQGIGMQDADAYDVAPLEVADAAADGDDDMGAFDGDTGGDTVGDTATPESNYDRGFDDYADGAPGDYPADYGDYDYVGEGGMEGAGWSDGNAPEMDCSCLGDIVGALLESDN